MKLLTSRLHLGTRFFCKVDKKLDNEESHTVQCSQILNTSSSDKQCNGNKQNLSIPKGYDKDVPDAFESGNATQVRIKYGIKQLRKVIETR